jgi:hypothetical protein
LPPSQLDAYRCARFETEAPSLRLSAFEKQERREPSDKPRRILVFRKGRIFSINKSILDGNIRV